MMSNKERKYAHRLEGSFEPEQQEEAEQAAREARLSAGEAAEPGDQQLERVDRLLHAAPLVNPSAGFAARVMAAVAAMTFPHMMNRRRSLGLALGMMSASLFTLPLLALATISVVDALADPGAANALMTFATTSVGSIYGLGSQYADALTSLVTDMPIVPALLTTAIPFSMLMMWVVWYMLGGVHWLLSRPTA